MSIRVYDANGIIQHVASTAGGNVIAVPGTTVTNPLGTVVFSNSNGVTFGIAGNTVTASAVGGGGGGAAISAAGNSQSTGTVVFSNSNNVSFGMAGSVVTATATMAGGGADGYNIVRAGTTGTTGTVWSSSAATVEINGSQNITVSQNNSNQIVLIGPSLAAYLTTAAQSNHSHGFSASGGSSAFQTLNFVNGNGITFTNNAGSVGASHNGLTTARASNDAIGLNTALTGNGVAWTVNSSGLSLNVPAFLTTAAQSNHSHGNPTLALTNLSGTTASASNGLTLSLSAAATVAQTAQTIGLYAVSNTTGAASSTTVDARTLSFHGAGIASVGYSAGSVVISVPAGGGGGGTQSVGMNSSTAGGGTGGTSGYATGTAVRYDFFAGSNVTLSGSVNGASGSLSIYGGAGAGGDGINVVQAGTTGTTGTVWSASTGTVLINGSNGITVSQNGSNQIVLVGNQSTVTSTIPEGMWPHSTASQTLNVLGTSFASALFAPFFIQSYGAFNHIMLALKNSYASTSNAASQSITFGYGLFSNNASTLSVISSSSFSMAVSHSVSTATVSYPTSSGTGGYGYGTISANGTSAIHGYFGTVGFKLLELAFSNSFSLTPGQYWLGLHQRNSSTSANVGISFGLACNAVAPIIQRAPFGQESLVMTMSSVSRQPLLGLGRYTVTSSILPSAVPISHIAHGLSNYPLITLDSL